MSFFTNRILRYSFSALLPFFTGLQLRAAGPFAYMAVRGNNTLAVIDTATNTLTTSITGFNGPFGVAVNPAGTRVYVADQTGGNLRVVDAASNTIVATIPMGDPPVGVAVNGPANKIYVTTQRASAPVRGGLVVVDANSNSVIASLTFSATSLPYGVVTSWNGSRVYVGDFADSKIYVLDGRTQAILSVYTNTYAPYGLALKSDGSRLYAVASLGDTLDVIDTTTMTRLAQIPDSGAPYGLALNPAETRAYTANTNTGMIGVMDLTNNTFIGAIALSAGCGGFIAGIAVHPTAATAYADNCAASAAVLSLTLNSLLTAVALANWPRTFGQFIKPPAHAAGLGAALQDGVVGDPYVAHLNGYGGSYNFSYAVTTGGLPSGLALNPATGLISGTPTAAGSYNFTVRLNDNAVQVATGSYTINIAAVPGFVLSTSSPLPAGSLGVAYTQTFATTGGTAPVDFMLLSGVLPPGLSLFATTGQISGTPSALGAYTFSVRAADAAGAITVKTYTLNVGNPVPTLTQLQPAYVTAGASGFTLTVTGSNFISGAVVRWNGADRPTTFVSATIATILVTAADVAIAGAATITIFNPAPGGGQAVPQSLTIAPPANAHYAYITTNSGAGGVSVVRVATNTLVTSIVLPSPGGLASGVTVSPDGAAVYVTYSNRIASIDAYNNTSPRYLTVGGGPNGVAVSPDGARLYVSNGTGNTVSVVDVPGWTVTATVGLAGSPTGVAINPAGTRVFVPLTNGFVNVIDTATNAVSSPFSTPTVPKGVAVSPDGARVAITRNNSFAVYYYDAVTYAGLGSYGVGQGPYGLAYGPDGTRLYVANTAGNSVSVINTATGGVVKTVTGMTGAKGITVAPDGSKVYVATTAGVGVINTADNSVTTTIAIAGALAFGNSMVTPPRISTLAPPARGYGGPGFTLTVNGAWFQPSSSVLWNGVSRPTVYASPGQLGIQLTAADVAAAGIAAVTVSTPPLASATSVPAAFTICDLASPGNSVTAMPSGGNLNLAWAASTNATSYNIKRCAGACLPAAIVANPAANSYSEVLDATSYFYAVEAVNACGSTP